MFPIQASTPWTWAAIRFKTSGQFISRDINGKPPKISLYISLRWVIRHILILAEVYKWICLKTYIFADTPSSPLDIFCTGVKKKEKKDELQVIFNFQLNFVFWIFVEPVECNQEFRLEEPLVHQQGPQILAAFKPLGVHLWNYTARGPRVEKGSQTLHVGNFLRSTTQPFKITWRFTCESEVSGQFRRHGVTKDLLYDSAETGPILCVCVCARAHVHDLLKCLCARQTKKKQRG